MILAATSATGDSSSIGSGATGSDRTAAPDASLVLPSLSGRDLPAFFLLLSQVDAAALAEDAEAVEAAAVVAATGEEAATSLVPALPNPVSL